VSIPVRVVSATENHSVSFRQIHTSDEGKIRYRKVCEAEGGREVPGEEIGKAYETADGGLVPLTDADLASLPLPTARTVDILGFVPLDSIDPYQMDKSYYLSPDSGAAKPYALLREALRRSGNGAIAKLAMRGRETLALLRPLEGEGEDVIGMHTLLWPDEIRPATAVSPTEKVAVRDAELDLADTLMDTLGPVELGELHDDYRSAVEALVSAKLAGTEPERLREPAAPGKVVDLMAALEDSVRSAREARGERGEGEEATVTPIGRGGQEKTSQKRAKKKTTTKRTAAKKETAKKPAPKKAAAKKPPGRKRAS
jgi:DNA end-binding protein Ku